MDRITGSLLAEFTKDFDLGEIAEDKRFEQFSSYITVRRHYSETFEPVDIALGGGSDTGIDAIAIIVNGALVTDVDDFCDLADSTSTLDVSFVFIQAERSSKFDAQKIGNFGFGVVDFFNQNPKLPRSDDVKAAAEIMKAIYDRSSKFKRSRPSCQLYYVTTGTWNNDKNLDVRRTSVISDLVDLTLFESVEFSCIGSAEVSRLYALTKNAISRTVQFTNRVELPEITGVKEAFLGYLPISEFFTLVKGEDGEIVRTIFYDNVRDWQEYNKVNDEMRETVTSDEGERFVLMNNGITVIARDLQRVGAKFSIEDFQIVNGCQTSHVLFDQRDEIDTDKVTVPLRLIVTQDETVIESIIRATNRQTQLREEQFISLMDFSRKLETFFQAFPPESRLYYERRSCQYNRLEVEKTRIITPPNLIRAFASVYLLEPHRTTRNFKSLLLRVGKDIFVPDHKLESYYSSAFALYKLEYFFRTQKIDGKYKAARFHLLMAARLLLEKQPLPQFNSKDMATRALAFADKLSDAKSAEALFTRAAKVIERAAAGNFHRDNIRTQPFTELVIEGCKAG
jgi:hypothetical protein